MKDHPNNKEAQKTPAEEIAEYISDELGIDIDPNSYRELIARIEKTFIHYVSLRTDIGLTFPFFETIKELEITISLLEDLTIPYIVLPEYDLGELHEKLLREDDTEFVIGDSDGERSRGRDIRAVKRQLRNMRNDLLGHVKSTNPIVTLARKNPNGWLTWRLLGYLRPAFPKPPTHDYQIHNVIYSLLKSQGVQKGESKDPARMISKRCKRFQAEIEPHLPPSE